MALGREIIVLDRAGLERLAGARARHGAAAGWSASLKTQPAGATDAGGSPHYLSGIAERKRDEACA